MSSSWETSNSNYGNYFAQDRSSKQQAKVKSSGLNVLGHSPSGKHHNNHNNDNVEYGSLIPDKGAGHREGFAAAYGSEHEGWDSRDNLQAGSLLPDKGAGQREGFVAAYGSEHEGWDSRDNLQAGSLLPDKGAGHREGFAAAYGSEHEGWDSRDNLQAGSLLPDKGAGQREGFAAAYGSEHEDWDSQDNLQSGSLLPVKGAGQREGFAAAYGSGHEGWDNQENRRPKQREGYSYGAGKNQRQFGSNFNAEDQLSSHTRQNAVAGKIKKKNIQMGSEEYRAVILNLVANYVPPKEKKRALTYLANVGFS